jgi:hypothetical protein
MKEKLNRFILNTQGNFQEVSYREAIYQCLDLVYEWIFVLDFPKATIQHLYAYQVFTEPNSLTGEYFEIIKNTPDFIPQDGDIGVFKATSGNIAGHIVVCLSGGNKSDFPCFEQNYPLGSNAHLTPNKSYTNFLGVLRPKLSKLDFVITEQTLLPIIDSKGNEMEVQSVRSYIADLELQNAHLLSKIDILNMEMYELQEKLNNATQSTLQESTGDSSDTVTVSEDGTQNSGFSLFQKIAELIKKLLGL